MRNWRTMAAVAGFLVLGAAGSARADIIIEDGPVGVAEMEVILFEQTGTTIDEGGLTVTGETNQTQELFSFTEDSEWLETDASGQATIEGTTGTYDYLLVDAVDPDTYYTRFEANVILSEGTSLTITATDSDGTEFPETFNGTGSGQNFFHIYVLYDQLIDTVLIQTTEGDFIEVVQQVRLGGVQDVPEVIPEPASLLLFGTGLAGLGGAVRRRMKARKTA